MLPGLSPASAPESFPSAPHNTLSSAGGSLTIVSRTSEAAAASFGEIASFAPKATSSSAREAVRFQIVSAWPALRRLAPMGCPIKPSPINPTLILELAADSTGSLLAVTVGCAALGKKCRRARLKCVPILLDYATGRFSSQKSAKENDDQAVLGRLGKGSIAAVPAAEAAEEARCRASSMALRESAIPAVEKPSAFSSSRTIY